MLDLSTKTFVREQRAEYHQLGVLYYYYFPHHIIELDEENGRERETERTRK